MKKLAIFTMFAMVFAFLGSVAPSANAAGVDLYADLTPDTNNNNEAGTGTGLVATTSVITTEAEVDTSATTTVYFSFLSDTELAASSTLTFTAPSGWTLADCSATSTTDADADGTAEGSFTAFGNSATYNLAAAATTLATTGGIEFCLDVVTDATSTNGVVTMASDDEVNPVSGAVFIYSGDDNDVLVTAEVQTTLYFVIRDSADAADTNACDLGVLDTATVSECSYRLAVETAAANGYTAYITSDGGLIDGGNDINEVTDDVTVAAGMEGYGIALAVATGTDTASTTEQNTVGYNFSADDTPIPTSKTALLSADGPYDYEMGTTTSSSLVTHRAAIDANTVAGNYTQTVSYYVTANY